MECQLLWVGVGPHNDHDPSRGEIVAPCIHVQTHLYAEMLISFDPMNAVLNPEL